MEAEIATQAVGLTSATDFSIINLFLRADIVVKSVIIILILASIYSWALIFDKYRLFKRIHKTSTIFEDKFWNSKSAELSGKSTGTPTVSSGAVTINIINKTNITSTKGVTLISLIGSVCERLYLNAMF